MLAASSVIAQTLPNGTYNPVALDILLAMHVAEEEAQYLTPGAVRPAGSPSPEITSRWIAVLIQTGLVEQKKDLIALTASGHILVSNLLCAVYDAQRALD